MSQRALLVIDVQNEYFSGDPPITYPHNHLDNILNVMDNAAAADVPVVVVQHTFLTDELPLSQRGAPEWELHEEVAERPHDFHVENNLPGSFTNTDLEEWLRKHAIDTITIAGYMTHMCRDTTARRQTVYRGPNVEFLSDATGTLAPENQAGQVTDEELQRAILCAQQMLLSEVIASHDWLQRL